MEKTTSKSAKLQFKGYYSQIFGAIVSCFRKAKLMPLEDLQCENPTFTQIAQDLKKFYRTMEILNTSFLEEDDKISQNELGCIKKYTELLERLGSAIDNEDIEEMTEVVAILAEEPYI
ncbi:hypothetical protein RHO15_09545 [Utexia brackfieldae]|uniref:hypothetical protein n=1 Tax=Utexia brackfieldae TaxID=3074108 RepID=UPI00370D2F9E